MQITSVLSYNENSYLHALNIDADLDVGTSTTTATRRPAPSTPYPLMHYPLPARRIMLPHLLRGTHTFSTLALPKSLFDAFTLLVGIENRDRLTHGSIIDDPNIMARRRVLRMLSNRFDRGSDRVVLGLLPSCDAIAGYLADYCATDAASARTLLDDYAQRRINGMSPSRFTNKFHTYLAVRYMDRRAVVAFAEESVRKMVGTYLSGSSVPVHECIL